MADFASLSPMTQGPLAEMLLALQRQGAAQKAQTGPILGQGIEGMLQGFQRQGELGRQREFSAGEAEKQRVFTDEQRMRGVADSLALEDYKAKHAAMIRAIENNAAMEREKEQQRGYTERETIAQQEATKRAKPTFLDYAKSFGSGISALGSGVMNMAEHQRKAAKDAQDAIIAREKIASQENIARDRMAVEAANRALTRQDAQGVRAINFANAKRRAMGDRYRRVNADYQKRTFGGIIQGPKELADKVAAAEFDAQQAEGEFFDLIAKYGVSPEMANPNMAAPPAAPSFEDEIDAIAEGR